ncbi:MAG: dTMP kinase [Variovorax sp.]
MSATSGQGLFVTLEGIDGAGKSSHLDAIEAALVGAGREVTRTREPGGTPLGEALRTLLLAHPMDPLSESLLVFAARREHVQQVIVPALARGAAVLCDRFTDATFAYQGGGRGFDKDILATLERWVQGAQGRAHLTDTPVLQPDLTLWFDLPPETAAQRLAGTRLPDKFEAEPVEFFRRVAAAYAERARAYPRFERIDAAPAPDVVRAQVLAVLRQRGLLPS